MATCLTDVPVGEVWPLDRLVALKEEINKADLEVEVIESVNIHEDIKKGLPTRDRYTENYLKTMENLAAIGIKCLCYNFMPVVDWARSDLAAPLPDGSTVMSYRHEEVVKMNPAKMADVMFSQAGLLPSRLGTGAPGRHGGGYRFYQSMTLEAYWANLRYFWLPSFPTLKSLISKWRSTPTTRHGPLWSPEGDHRCGRDPDLPGLA